MLDKITHFLTVVDREWPDGNPKLVISDGILALQIIIKDQWLSWGFDDDFDFDPDRMICQMKKDLQSVYE